MSRKIQISDHYSLEELQVLLPKVQNLEARFRMLVIERILSNPKISRDEICKSFYISPDTLYRWLTWYNEGGLEKLKNGNGGKGINSGIQTIYNKEMFDALADKIDKNQDMVWTLEKMQLFLKEQFNLEEDQLPTIQAIYHRMKKEYSYKSSRPYPKQANRDDLGRFKKTV